MIQKRFILSGLCSVMLLAGASCSLINTTDKTDKTDKADKKTEILVVEVPKDRKPVVTVRPSATYTPQELKQDVVKGDWAIEQVNEKVAVGETAPYIKFEPIQGRIYGNNGCNTINGNYKYSAADHTIRFTNMISTLAACGMTGITDTEINLALEAARTYRLEEKSRDYLLYLMDAEGKTVLTLIHQNFDFLNGTWLVQSIKEKTVNVKGRMLVPDMKLVIDVAECKVHGNTGCNILNGDFAVDMDRPNSISFENMATTRMSCPPDNNFETDLLVALEEATTARAVDASTVELLNSQKQVIMVLKRTTDK